MSKHSPEARKNLLETNYRSYSGGTSELVNELVYIRNQGKGAAKKLRENPELPPDQKYKLEKQTQEGKKALQAMIDLNYGVVIKLAKKFELLQGPKQEQEDAINEGLLAAFRACHDFNPKRNNALVTVVWTYVRNIYIKWSNFHDPLSQSSYHSRRNYIQNNTKQELFEQQLGRRLTLKEFADESGRSLRGLRQTAEASHRQPVVSLDAPSSAYMDSNLEDETPDPNSPDPEQAVLDKEASMERQQAISDIRAILDNLAFKNPGDKDALIRYFGLDGKPALKMKAIGKIYGISKETVSKRIQRAKKTLAQSPEFQELTASSGERFSTMGASVTRV